MKDKILTIMFTDLKGFTSRTEKSSRESILGVIHEHHELVIGVVSRFKGNIVKSIGDALLVTFDSATAGVLAGVEIQRVFRERNEDIPQDDRIEIRVAINTGEVTETADDVFGDAVNIASRVEDIAQVGEVYLTESTYLSMQPGCVPTGSLGLKILKGVTAPVRIYRVVSDSEELVGEGSQHTRQQSFFQLVVKPILAAASSMGGLTRGIQRPAPLEDRTLATLIDILIAITLALAIPAVTRLPQVVASLTDTFRVEIESMTSENTSPLAHEWNSGGAALSFLGKSKASASFAGEAGLYDVVVSQHSTLSDEFLKIYIGDHIFHSSITFPGPVNMRTLLAKGIRLERGTPIVVSFQPISTEGGPENPAFKAKAGNRPPSLDYIDFIPVDSNAVRPIGVERTYRYQNLWYLIDYDDMNVHFFLLRIPLFFLFLNFVFLSLVSWTPGCYMQRLRIRTLNGNPPGVFLSLMRVFGFLVSWSILFIGIAWMFITRSQRTWADIASGTRVYKI